MGALLNLPFDDLPTSVCFSVSSIGCLSVWSTVCWSDSWLVEQFIGIETMGAQGVGVQPPLLLIDYIEFQGGIVTFILRHRVYLQICEINQILTKTVSSPQITSSYL